MHRRHATGRAIRWMFLTLAVALVAAGCAAPEESGPADLNRDDDRDGLPDAPGTGTTGPGLDNETGEDSPMTNDTMTQPPLVPDGDLDNAPGTPG